MMEKFNLLYNNKTINKVLEQQVINLLNKKVDSFSKLEIQSNELRKAIWLTSVLANSKNELHLKKVQDFAILLFLNNSDNIEVLKIVYILFSRIGNLTATRFLTKLINNKGESKFQENVILTQELAQKRFDNSVLINQKPYLLTDFQKELYESLQHDTYISISAPTSSGKSFIIKKYIEYLFTNNQKYCVFYIVPSRALINQVSEELRSELPEITIKNAFIENEIIDYQKKIYVITPERAVKIINSETGLDLPDLIFIDEIQNVENENERGNLFEYVYDELSKVSPKTKIITAGPFISNSGSIFKELFEKKCEVVNTDLSPVFQLCTIANFDKDKVSLTLFANNKIFYTIDNFLSIEGIEKDI